MNRDLGEDGECDDRATYCNITAHGRHRVPHSVCHSACEAFEQHRLRIYMAWTWRDVDDQTNRQRLGCAEGAQGNK